ncbi:MAG TPA: zf-HC2 domain-containing protein [Candidatus Limnocylindrales bacterium]|nr:zf-HC2 domain-containing protein [Candidatus Limnocylindrales bacterium]
MTERAQFPSSPACGQWETLLAEALDGLLKPEDEATFNEHMAGCKACAALYEEARRGCEWLEFLSPEPEVPAGLLDRILAQTGPGQVEGFGLLAGNASALPIPQARNTRNPGVPAWQHPGFMAQVRRFAEPRLMMTAAMAFFSLALTLNLSGIKLNELRLASFRPAAIRAFMERRIVTASVPIVRYYDHLRYIYEVESRMRDFRRSTEGDDNDSTPQNNPSQSQPGESKKTPPRKDGGSRMDLPQQSGRPEIAPAYNTSSDLMEATLTFHGTNRAFRQLQDGTKETKVEERSTTWTA